MLPVSLDCPFFIAPSVVSNVYLNNYSPTSITYSHHPDLHTKYFKLSPGVTPVSNIVFPSLKWSNVTVVHTDIYPNTTIITQHKYFIKSLSRTCTLCAFLD